ncbi:MAG: NAD(P)-dependent oxidoreductase, partial [Planctomycetota bacterium]
GRAVARRARGFSMRVLYASRTRAPAKVEQELHARQVPLDTLLQQSDFVSMHVPLGPETRHMISVEQLCRMKRSAFLINTSRGPIVDEAALVAALEEGLLAGAGLDVFEQEPGVHPGLLALENVVLLPHVGSAVTSVRSLMCALAAKNCVAVLTGERPPHPVNPEVLG